MNVSSSYELNTFFVSLVLGFFIGFLYDFVRSIKLNTRLDFFFDIIFWLMMGIGSMSIWLKYLDGQIRWYLIVGVILSLVIYFFVFSRWIYFALSFVMKKIFYFFCLFFKFLLTPIRILGKMVYVHVNKINKKFFVKVEEGIENEKT